MVALSTRRYHSYTASSFPESCDVPVNAEGIRNRTTVEGEAPLISFANMRVVLWLPHCLSAFLDRETTSERGSLLEQKLISTSLRIRRKHFSSTHSTSIASPYFRWREGGISYGYFDLRAPLPDFPRICYLRRVFRSGQRKRWEKGCPDD